MFIWRILRYGQISGARRLGKGTGKLYSCGSAGLEVLPWLTTVPAVPASVGCWNSWWTSTTLKHCNHSTPISGSISAMVSILQYRNPPSPILVFDFDSRGSQDASFRPQVTRRVQYHNSSTLHQQQQSAVEREKGDSYLLNQKAPSLKSSNQSTREGISEHEKFSAFDLREGNAQTKKRFRRGI